MLFGFCNGQHNGSYPEFYGDGDYLCENVSEACGAAVHQGVISNSGGVFKFNAFWCKENYKYQ